MKPFRVASAGSTHSDPSTALRDALQGVVEHLGPDPDLLIVAASAAYDTAVLVAELAEARRSGVHGFTSCLGCMTHHGVHAQDGTGLGVLGIRDPDGSYGSSLVAMEEDARGAGREAVNQALADAGRPGELPVLVLVNATPGREEEVLEGIQEVVGKRVPILGGSAADNEVAGGWRVFGAGVHLTAGVAVSVLFPSVEVSFAFRSGYQPDGPTGTVTAAEDRVLREIENEPAAQVYNRWAGGVLDPVISAGGSALPLTSLNPLGRAVGELDGIIQFKLSHPERVLPDGSLVLFTTVQEGDVLHAMSGSPGSLIARGGRVVESAFARSRIEEGGVSGALITYCAGCMLAVREDLSEVCRGICDVIPETPFLGSFTFGEQGCFLGGDNRHANLMISAILFGS